MGFSRDILRKKAKKAYKEQFGKLPKKDRVTFAYFFKQFKAIKNNDLGDNEVTVEEDFDFDSMINTEE